MASKKTPLINGNIYHIFNKGNNNETLFRENSDYEHFLRLMDKYLTLVVEIYAWVLMNNHFHLLIKIREESKIEYLKPIKKSENGTDENKWKVIPDNQTNEYEKKKLKKSVPLRQFSHLFNAYTKYFNKKYQRTGSLFQKSFSRKIIFSKNYLKYMVYYIHHNPVHHGFVEKMIEYPWSSYLLFPSPEESHLSREEVILWFDDIKNYERFHLLNHDFKKFKNILFE